MELVICLCHSRPTSSGNIFLTCETAVLCGAEQQHHVGEESLYPGPSNYQTTLVVFVLWLFWTFCLFCDVLRYFAELCGRLLAFCLRFALICGRFDVCADLRSFAQKTGLITKTTRNFWSFEDPGCLILLAMGHDLNLH